MRRLPIQKVVNLGYQEWIMIYQSGGRRNNYNAANNVYEGLCECSNSLGVSIEEPHFVEL